MVGECSEAAARVPRGNGQTPALAPKTDLAAGPWGPAARNRVRERAPVVVVRKWRPWGVGATRKGWV